MATPPSAPADARPAPLAPAGARPSLASTPRLLSGLLLALILLAAAALRFSGPNWDQGQSQHPDERFIVMVTQGLELPKSVLEYFDTGHSTLNPYNRGFDGFAYGTLPVFLVKTLSIVLDKSTFDE